MATLKLVLRTRENKDGTRPILIRITKDRKTSVIHVGYHVKASDWDDKNQRVKKSHPNSARLNNLLLTKLSEATNKALEMETQKDFVTSKAVQQQIKPKGGQTFFGQAELYLETLKANGKYNQYTADKPRIKHFKDFINGADILFSEVDVNLLNRFRTYLKSEYKTSYKTKPRLSERSIVNHLVTIRSIFSFARKAQVIDRKISPFGEDGIKIVFPESVKIGLTQEEVIKLENVQLDNPYHNHCRNLWLYSFYFGGMRVADVLLSKWSNFQDGRLHYVMGKNDKAGSLKVSDKVRNILTQYQEQKSDDCDLIFPELKRLDNFNDEFLVKRTIAFSVSSIDKCLREDVAPAAEITKKLTMHIARHTFGNLSGDKIPIQMLQKIYRHSDIKTTLGYQQNFIHQEADEALEAVIGF